MGGHFQYPDAMRPHHAALHTACTLSSGSGRARAPSRATWTQERMRDMGTRWSFKRNFLGGGGIFFFPILKELKGLEQFGEAHGPRDFSAASASSRALSVWWVWGRGMEGWPREGARQEEPATCSAPSG